MATKKYRVLADVTIEEQHYKPNQVVIMDDALGMDHEKAGALDSKTAAVKYALTLGDAIEHVSPSDEAPTADAAGEGEVTAGEGEGPAAE